MLRVAFAGGCGALGFRLATTRRAFHSPEIEYLQDGVNGVLTAATAAGFASGVTAVLEDDELRARLQAGARATAEQLALANSVERFADGIVACLRRGRRLD